MLVVNFTQRIGYSPLLTTSPACNLSSQCLKGVPHSSIFIFTSNHNFKSYTQKKKKELNHINVFSFVFYFSHFCALFSLQLLVLPLFSFFLFKFNYHRELHFPFFFLPYVDNIHITWDYNFCRRFSQFNICILYLNILIFFILIIFIHKNWALYFYKLWFYIFIIFS